ncbi:MAG: hypothetical protein ACLVLA_09745 [Acidaminococcus intestini]
MSFENMGTVVEDKVFGWEDEITAEGGNKSYTLLEEGDYPFVIKEVERSMYEPKIRTARFHHARRPSSI